MQKSGILYALLVEYVFVAKKRQIEIYFWTQMIYIYSKYKIIYVLLLWTNVF